MKIDGSRKFLPIRSRSSLQGFRIGCMFELLLDETRDGSKVADRCKPPKTSFTKQIPCVSGTVGRDDRAARSQRFDNRTRRSFPDRRGNEDRGPREPIGHLAAPTRQIDIPLDAEFSREFQQFLPRGAGPLSEDHQASFASRANERERTKQCREILCDR